MAKPLIIVLGLVAVAGTAYGLRNEIKPMLPETLATALAAIDSKPGDGKPESGGPAGKGAGKDAKGAPSKKGGGGPAPVTVAAAVTADMPVVLSAPGTVEATATVSIKPRVDGQVISVGFEEGDMVDAGAVLYKLDDRLVRAQIKQAEAQITRDQASLKDAISIAERRETLFQKKYASEAATETARQNVEVLRASIAAGQAQLEMQRTQLDYLTIRAPIGGRTGSATAKLGTFVRSADPIPLVTINQTKPITVSFALPQVTLQQVKAALAANATAVVTIPGAKPTKVTGVLNFVDNQVDKTTGTVTVKLNVENKDEALWPGQAVGVDLTAETRRGLIAVPASAVMPAQQGMIAWVVGGESKVSVRPVVLDRVMGQTAYLTSGLKAGERVVTDGQLRLAPGATVSIRDPQQPGAKGNPTTGSGRPQGKTEQSGVSASGG